MYLTIPEIVESEEMLSVSPEADGVTFGVIIGVGDTSARLMSAHDRGEHLELVVLTTDAQTLALDSVYVSGISVVAEPPAAHVTFLAREVRIF